MIDLNILRSKETIADIKKYSRIEIMKILGYMRKLLKTKATDVITAKQINFQIPLIMMRVYNKYETFLLPQIREMAGVEIHEETDFSFRNIYANVLRSSEINVSYIDIKTMTIIEGKQLIGEYARIFQRGYDYLSGVIFLDRALADNIPDKVGRPVYRIKEVNGNYDYYIPPHNISLFNKVKIDEKEVETERIGVFTKKIRRNK